MNKEKIAVLTDSGNDILKDFSKDLFILPLLIHIDEDTYIDGQTITLEEVLDVIDEKKVTTSLPSSDVIIKTLDTIKESGYTHVIINTISSKLSGTNNIIRLITEDYQGLEIAIIDTKNISKASGYTAHLALELIEEGKPFKEIVETLNNSLEKHKVFFTVGSVEYLRKGGRIGLVAGTVANIFGIKPIITCNETGVYHSVGIVRGYNKAINKMISLAKGFIEKIKSFDITVLTAKIDEKTEEVLNMIKEQFNNAKNFEVKPVSTALAIHTGPRAIGIALRIRD